jgi:cell division protein FtsB
VVFCNKISSIQGGEKILETTDTLLQLLQEAHKTNQAQQQTIQNLTTEIQLLNEKDQLFNQQIIWTL